MLIALLVIFAACDELVFQAEIKDDICDGTITYTTAGSLTDGFIVFTAMFTGATNVITGDAGIQCEAELTSSTSDVAATYCIMVESTAGATLGPVDAIVTDSWENVASTEVKINIRIDNDDVNPISATDLSAYGEVQTGGTEYTLPNNLGSTTKNVGTVVYNVQCGDNLARAVVLVSVALLGILM